MLTDDELLFPPRPFGFARDDLLTNVLRAEITVINHLRATYPELPNLFDVPEATVPERRVCFAVLAHRKIMDMIYETFSHRHFESPSLGNEELTAIEGTQNLFASDAPAWVSEMNEVVERLPSRIYAALPEPLRTRGFDANDSVKVESFNLAALELSSVEQIQALTNGVLDQQLQRLERRWSAATVQLREPNEVEDQKRKLKGLEGLGPKKAHLSEYKDNLTEKQQLAFSLKFEYELGLAQIASRMGIDRKTAYEHIEAAKKKIEEVGSSEKRKARRSKVPEA